MSVFLGLLGAGLVGGAAYACGLEPLWLRTERLDIELPGLDPEFDGYRVIQLSDLHVGPAVPSRHLRRAVSLANSLAPDLIVVTGDLVDRAEDRTAPERTAELLAGASARDGVLAILGNHDLGSYQPGQRGDPARVSAMDAVLARAGVTLLHNDLHRIERGRRTLRIAGMGDLWSGQFEPDRVALHDPGGCTIALSHNPDTAPELARRGVDLTLSGHTHGGQIDLPLFGPPYIPLANKHLLEGHIRLGRSQLYVNRGLGWSHRVRFGARPEVTVLQLRSA